MNKKIKTRDKLKEYGYGGAYQYTLNDEEFIIDFKVDAGFAYGFSEITLLNYVAESYRNSTLTLLRKVNKIADCNESKSTYEIAKYSYGYIPAMFCFRHYLELKLKSLYMTINRMQFNSVTHDLTELFSEIKTKIQMLHIDSIWIENAVKYVDLIEKKNQYHFRYYIDKKFKPTTQIIISYKTILDELEKIILDFSKCSYEIEKTIEITRLRLVKEKGGTWNPETHGEMTFDIICRAIDQ